MTLAQRVAAILALCCVAAALGLSLREGEPAAFPLAAAFVLLAWATYPTARSGS